jgi:hypothetical protein
LWCANEKSKVAGPKNFWPWFSLQQKIWLYFISTDNWGGPEILDQLYFIHTENLDWSIWIGPEILDHFLYFNHTENLGRSRNSGPTAFHSNRKSGRLVSRNSGPDLFHSVRKSGAFQKFWTSCISFQQKIWGGPEILEPLFFTEYSLPRFSGKRPARPS